MGEYIDNNERLAPIYFERWKIRLRIKGANEVRKALGLPLIPKLAHTKNTRSG